MYNEKITESRQSMANEVGVLNKIQTLESSMADLRQSIEALEKILAPICRPCYPKDVIESVKEKIPPEPSHIGGFITSLIIEITRLNFIVIELTQRIDI